MRRLYDHGVDVRDLAVDTRLAAYLLDPADNVYDLGALLFRHCGMELPGRARRRATRSRRRRHGGCRRGAEPRGARRAPPRDAAPRGDGHAGAALLHDDLEVPLVRVLAKMEYRGIGVDPDVLQAIRDELVAETEAKRAAVIEHAGHDFNVNSTKQLREVLFDELGLTPQKKTKTGYSTDAQSLEKMRPSIRSSRTSCSTAKSRSCVRPMARVCSPRSARETGSAPRSSRPWPEPVGFHRISRTCTTFPCAPSGGASSAPRSWPRRATNS